MTRLHTHTGGAFPDIIRNLDKPAPTVTTSGGFASGGHAWLEQGGPMYAATDEASTKPPYRVPSMDEVRATGHNGLVVVSTFSGAGGSCTGYRMAGFEVLWANEFEPNASLCYAANHPTTVLDTRDIRSITGGDIREAIGDVDIDLFDGSPPCQSFSTAGSRSTHWGEAIAHSDGTHQRSDDLFFEYIRLVGDLRPRAFVAENVQGLVGGVAKGMFRQIMAKLKGHGYKVRARVLDAQWLGVPQHRQRVFIIGVREDVGFDPPYPQPLGYRYSMLDACPWLRSADSYKPRQGGWKEQPTELTKPAPTVIASQRQGQLIAHEIDDLRTQFGPNPAHVNRFGLDEPAPTIMAAGINSRRQGQATVKGDGHAVDPETGQRLKGDGQPMTRRRLTIPEIRRLCSFPDDYVLLGTYIQRWARLGNSVPPLMARAVGEALAKRLLE
jgi:DNA (cytosine-5)-methyltransferase 1